MAVFVQTSPRQVGPGVGVAVGVGGVGVTVGVAVGVGMGGVGEGVGVAGVAVGVEVGEGVGVGEAVGVAVGVDEGVAVGVGVPAGPPRSRAMRPRFTGAPPFGETVKKRPASRIFPSACTAIEKTLLLGFGLKESARPVVESSRAIKCRD